MVSVFKQFGTKDCLKILKKKYDTADFTVNSFEFRPVNEKIGYLGTHCYLKVQYQDKDENKILQCFAKTIPATEAPLTFLEETGSFIKECAFFRSFASDLLDNGIKILDECTATSYAVCMSGQYLVFEDLTLKNFTTIDHRPSLSLECVKVALDALAKFHCSGLILEEKMEEKTGETFRLDQKYPNVFKESFFIDVGLSMKLVQAAKSGGRAVIDLAKDELKVNIELFKKLMEEVYDDCREIVKPSTKFRNTVCHADLWAGNLMFMFKDGKPIRASIVDFQMQRYAPPAQDIMMFLYMTTDLEFREQHLKFLTAYYYEQVDRILKDYNLSTEKILPYDDYVESCDYYRIYGICLSLNHNQLLMVPQEDTEDMFNNLERIMFGDRTEHIQKYYAACESYRKKSFETIITLQQALVDIGKLQLSNQ